MKTIILTEERVDANPRLISCLRTLFPECRVLIACAKACGPAPSGSPPSTPECCEGKTDDAAKSPRP